LIQHTPSRTIAEHWKEPDPAGLPSLEQPGVSWVDRLIRWGAAVSVLLVTGIAAVISYGHAFELVTRYGESGATARALPLTVDGLVATCSLVILYCTRHARRTPWNAWALLITGVCATVGANVAHGLSHGVIGATVAGWPALVACGTFELLIRLLRDSRPAPRSHPSPHTGLGNPVDTAPAPRTSATDLHDPNDQDAPAATAEPARPRPALWAEPEIAAAAERYADDLADGRVPSIRQLKRELHVGHPRAFRIHHALAAQPATHADTRAADPITTRSAA
jgi:hypothetical protein